MKKNMCGLFVYLMFFPLVSSVYAVEPVRLLAETEKSISIAVEVPTPVFIPRDDGQGVVCSVAGFGPYTEIGVPGVVVRGIMAAIPPGRSVSTSIAVHDSQEFDDIDLAPVSIFHDPAYGTDATDGYIKNQQVYQSDAWFPPQPADVSFTGLLRGTSVAQVSLTPVQYNPVQRKLRVVRSMVVTLHFDSTDDAGVFVATSGDEESAIARFFDTIKNTSLVNPVSPSVSMRIDSAPGQALVFSKTSYQFPDELQNSPFAIRITTSDSGIHREIGRAHV